MGVSGVILAAGSSSRLGRSKQLLTLDGEPIVRVVVRNALAAKLDEVVLVTGSESDAVLAAVGDAGQRTIFNSDYRSGQSTSLKAGLREISPEAGSVLFLLGDQPEVGPDIIDRLVDAFQEHGAAIVQPVYGSTPANPVLFSRELFSDLLTIDGDQGARSIVKRYADTVLRVVVSDGPAPGDVDTDEDYRALISRWAERNASTT
jgi:molybdenum cofactor cytidylyltransferase